MEGELIITHSEALQTLEGAPGLRSVGHLTVESNDALRSMQGLSALEIVTGDLRVSGNAVLPQTDVAAFAARVEVGGEQNIGAAP